MYALTTFMLSKERKFQLKQLAKEQKVKSRELIIKAVEHTLSSSEIKFSSEDAIKDKAYTSLRLPSTLLKRIREFALKKDVSFGRVVRFSVNSLIENN